MIQWIIILVLILLMCVYFGMRKIYNEHKIKNRRRDLVGQVVLITGASSGIGEALAQQFYASGCKVILAARRISELERVRRDLLNSKLNNGIQSLRPDILQLDLAESNQVIEKANNLLSSGLHVDILINNGGVSLVSDIQTVKQEVDARIMNVNYFGTIALTKAFLPSMMKRKEGKIVFVSSVVGRFSIPFSSSYTASKHALQSFADCLRAEVAAYNIKVMVSNPGYVATEILKNALTGNGTIHGATNRAIAAGQKPQECADEILRALLRGDNEIIPLKFLVVVWIRSIFPTIYFGMMEARARKIAARHKAAHIV